MLTNPDRASKLIFSSLKLGPKSVICVTKDSKVPFNWKVRQDVKPLCFRALRNDNTQESQVFYIYFVCDTTSERLLTVYLIFIFSIQ